MSDCDRTDLREIQALISRQFRSMSWQDAEAPDSTTFKADFRRDAVLYPSARPVQPVSIDAFADRMNDLSKATLRSFQERVLGQSIKFFGNVAVAVVACENTENGSEVNRNVEMMLLVKEQGNWKIVAQAWDKESEKTPAVSAMIEGT